MRIVTVWRACIICAVALLVGMETIHLVRFGDLLPLLSIHVDLAQQDSSQGQHWYAVSVRNMTWRSFEFVGLKDRSYSHLSCSNNLIFAYALERKDANNQWQTLIVAPDANTVAAEDKQKVTLLPLQSVCGGEWMLLQLVFTASEGGTSCVSLCLVP